jgi:RNA polymerase sigma-70 factor, ECF subfamily
MQAVLVSLGLSLTAVTATPSDADLVQRSLTGDRQAFHTLTERWYRPVCGFLLRRLNRPDLIEDLAQETFLEAYQAITDGRRPEHFSSWLFGIAHNRLGKWLRRSELARFTHEPLVELAAPPEPDTVAEAEEAQRLTAQLEQSLAELPAETRRMLELKHRHDRTCEDIARELGRPVGTVKSQLARTYKALRQKLSGTREAPL